MTDTVRELAERAAVADTVTRMTWYLDRRDWDGLEAAQHQLTNVLVNIDGDKASATANVVGVHRLTTRTALHCGRSAERTTSASCARATDGGSGPSR